MEKGLEQSHKIMCSLLKTMNQNKNKTASPDIYVDAVINTVADKPEKAKLIIEIDSPRHFRLIPGNVYTAVLLYHNRTYDQVGDGDHHEEKYEHQDSGTFTLDEDGDVIFIRDRDEAMYPCITEFKL